VRFLYDHGESAVHSIEARSNRDGFQGSRDIMLQTKESRWISPRGQVESLAANSSRTAESRNPRLARIGDL
jgi:hypothetical protein